MTRYISTALLAVFLLINFFNCAFAQSNELKIENGRTADFLFVTDRKDVEHLKPAYFKDVYPPAQKIGFQRANYFLIKEQPISGEYFPYVVAIGSWPGDWKNRQALFDELKTLRPDIRSRRLDIWSSFNMLNVTLDENIDLVFDPEKIYVLGAYWQKDESSFANFQARMLAQTKEKNGQILFYNKDVKTLFGYTEPATMMTITEWESQAAFDEYYARISESLEQATKARSEFYLSIPQPKQS